MAISIFQWSFRVIFRVSFCVWKDCGFAGLLVAESENTKKKYFERNENREQQNTLARQQIPLLMDQLVNMAPYAQLRFQLMGSCILRNLVINVITLFELLRNLCCYVIYFFT